MAHISGAWEGDRIWSLTASDAAIPALSQDDWPVRQRQAAIAAPTLRSFPTPIRPSATRVVIASDKTDTEEN